MPSQATKKRRSPAAGGASSPDETKKKMAVPTRRRSDRAEEEAGATPSAQQSKRQKRSGIAPTAESNKQPSVVKDPYDFDDEEEIASLSPAGAAGSPRFLSGLLESARKKRGKVSLFRFIAFSSTASRPRPLPFC